MLELKNITKKYKKRKKIISVLENLNYKFENGKLYCISGKSGAGKTTLIQLLGLLHNQTSGDIFINNKNTKKLTNNEKAKIRNKEIGFVFQSFYLNSLMKAYENVMLPGYINEEITNKELMKKACDLLTELGLEDRINHFPKELSGGEQQRVAIARALINNPNIILADEPTGSLDPETEDEILNILKDLADKGKCVIVVSHTSKIKEYADVVLMLKEHKLNEVRND